MPAAARPRRAHRPADHLLAQGVHPPDQLCRDRCGYCTFAKPPARLDVAVPRAPTRCSAIARAGAGAGCSRGAVHPGRAAGGALPGGRGMAGRARLRLDRRLPGRRVPARASTRPGCSPTPTRARCTADELPRLRPVSAVAGDDDRDAATAELGLPTAASPDKTPARRLATLEAAGELGDPVHHRHPGRHRRDPGRPPRRSGRDRRVSHRATRPRAGGHRPELPAQAGHRHAPRPTRARPDEYLWSIAAARLMLPPDDPPAGAAEPVRRLRVAARRRHRRLGRRVAGHRRPRQPGAALARARPAARRSPRPPASPWRPA